MIDRNCAPGRIAALCAALVVGGCGGGGGDDPAQSAGPTSAARIAAAGATAQADATRAHRSGRSTGRSATARSASLRARWRSGRRDRLHPGVADEHRLGIEMALREPTSSETPGRRVERGRLQVPATSRAATRASSSCTPDQTVAGVRRRSGPTASTTRPPTASSSTAAATWRSTPSLIGLGAARQCGARRRDAGAVRHRRRARPTPQPQLAGGVVTSAGRLRGLPAEMLSASCRWARLLGSHPVCTNPRPAPLPSATPIPPSESWHYSIGHWVEDDPTSATGVQQRRAVRLLSLDRRLEDLVRRRRATWRRPARFDSVDCGRLIRKAWLTGIAQ